MVDGHDADEGLRVRLLDVLRRPEHECGDGHESHEGVRDVGCDRDGASRDLRSPDGADEAEA